MFPVFLDARPQLRETARLAPFAGQEMPLVYSSSRAEHLATRQGAGLFDVSHMRRWLLDEHALEALYKIAPLAPDTPEAGRQTYSVVLSESGTIVDDIMVLRTGAGGGGEIWMVSNAGTESAVRSALENQLAAGAKIPSPAVDTAMFAIQGPHAQAIVETRIARVRDLYFLDVVKEGDLVISRSGYTGEDGFEVFGPAASVAVLAETLLQDERTTPCGLAARDSLRLEAGMLLSGSDLAQPLTPKEAGLGFVAKRVPECVREVSDGGKCLRFVQIHTARVARAGQDALSQCGASGKVTSGAFCPSAGTAIALVLFAEKVAFNQEVAIRLNEKTSLQGTVIKPGIVPKRYKRGE